MPTLLQARQTLDATVAAHAKTPSAAAFVAAQRAHDDYIAALAAAGENDKLPGAITAKVTHREKYEKVTTETPDKSEKAADDPAESSDPMPATDASARGEDKPAESDKPDAKGKGGKMRGEEEEDDSKEASAFVIADKAYKKAARGANVDAYALHGPAKLLEAVQKLTGQTSVASCIGALAGIGEKLLAADKLTSRVAKLETNDRAARVSALVEDAKLAGKTTGSKHRTYLREQGMQHGTAHLRAMVEHLPVVARSQPYDANEDGNDGRGQFQGGDAQAEAALAKILPGIPASQREGYATAFRDNLKAKQPKIAKA